MSTEFRNDSGVQFSNLGLTTAIVGATGLITLYDSSTGQTTSASFQGNNLNYVLGSEMVFTYPGTAYTTMVGSVLSLTTQSNRIVEITAISGGSQTTIGIRGATLAGNFCVFRFMRGPSTILGDYPMGGYSPGNASDEFYIPPTALRAFDFSPPAGAATYLIQMKVGTAGLSLLIDVSGLKAFVRQI